MTESIDVEKEIKQLKAMIPSIMDKKIDHPDVIDFQNKILNLKRRATSTVAEKKLRVENYNNSTPHRYQSN
ncbi:MAG: hypothetical protein V7749_00770 [Cocleimonas sp.]